MHLKTKIYLWRKKPKPTHTKTPKTRSGLLGNHHSSWREKSAMDLLVTGAWILLKSYNSPVLALFGLPIPIQLPAYNYFAQTFPSHFFAVNLLLPSLCWPRVTSLLMNVQFTGQIPVNFGMSSVLNNQTCLSLYTSIHEIQDYLCCSPM